MTDTKEALKALETLCEYEFRHVYMKLTPQDAQKAIDTIKSALQSQGWHSVKGWEDFYEVSSVGVIRRKSDQSIVGTWLKKGYHQARLSNPRKCIYVHRIVAEAFVKNNLCLPVVNHKDFNTVNNYFGNLEWCTQEQNVAHSRSAGRYPENYWKGKRSPSALLTDEQVIEVKELRKSGMSYSKIADKVGSNKKTVGLICVGKAYV